MGSQTPMNRQLIFLKVGTAWFGFVAAFVFTAADVVIIILRVIFLECIKTVKPFYHKVLWCDYLNVRRTVMSLI